MAIVGLQDELSQVRRQLTGAAAAAGVGGADPATAAASVRDWLGGRLHGIGRYRALLNEAAQAAEPDLAMMSVVVRALVDLGRMI
jgi:NAD-specific glutamate dehydrogenase